MEGYQKNIADHMLLFRKICAIKQEDLAQMSGLSMTQLRNIEPVSYTHLDVYKRQAKVMVKCVFSSIPAISAKSGSEMMMDYVNWREVTSVVSNGCCWLT